MFDLRQLSLILLITPSLFASRGPLASRDSAIRLDHEGTTERIIGDSKGQVRGVRTGTVIVTSASEGEPLFSFAGDSAGDRFGWSVAFAGDVDADGTVDFIIGAPLDDVGGNASGSAFVYSGRDGRLLHRFTGCAAREQFGYSVAGAGDVNGDGFADLVVGAPYADGVERNEGYTRVFSGKDGSVIRTVRGKRSNERFGRSVLGKRAAAPKAPRVRKLRNAVLILRAN